MTHRKTKDVVRTNETEMKRTREGEQTGRIKGPEKIECS
jgi:hypothetical protein